jgi:hypothetical protein
MKKNAIKKDGVKGNIVILDEGIDTKNIFEPDSLRCCWTVYFPFRV